MALVDEISVKLGISTSEFKAALKDADAGVQEFSEHSTSGLGGLFDSLEHRVTGMRHLSGAIATALGLNLEKIAETIAQVITGVSKADEEAFKQLSDLSDKATELVLKNMRSRLTEEQKLTLLIQDRDRLQKQLDESTAHTAEQLEEQAKVRIELETKVSEINEIEAKQQQDAIKAEAERQKLLNDYVKQRQDASEKEFQAYLSTLGTKQKIDALEDDIAIKEAMINAGAVQGAEVERNRNIIATERNEITKEEGKIFQEMQKYGKDSVALDEQLKKLAFDKLTPEQQLAALKEEEAKLEDQIQDTTRDENDIKRDEVKLAQDQIKSSQIELDIQQQITKQKKTQHEVSQQDLDIATQMISMAGFTVDSNAANQKINEQNLAASSNESLQRQIDALEADIAKAQASGATTAQYIIAQDRKTEDALRNRLNNSSYLFDPNYVDSLGKGIAATSFHSQDVDAASLQQQTLSSINKNLTDLNNHVTTALPLQ